MMKLFRRQFGLTLPEMTVVIAIAALLVMLTLPAANMLFRSFESESSTKIMLSAALASARAIAAKEQRYAGIRFQKRYDPNNPDPLNAPQYMIFIIQDPTIMAYGFRAVDGLEPIKLPDPVGVMDLAYRLDTMADGDAIVNDNAEIANINVLRDTTTFSIIFSPSGKLVIHEVRTRNRNGYTATGGQYSKDDVFNSISQIEAGFGMFLQDDYFAAYEGKTVTNLGLGPENSRNSFIIYETKKLKEARAAGLPWTGYLKQVAQKPIYINAYIGTIVEQ